MEKFLHFIIPNSIGFVLTVIGWYVSILNVGLSRFQTNVLFTKWTLIGLLLIIIGGYVPRVWSFIKRKR